MKKLLLMGSLLGASLVWAAGVVWDGLQLPFEQWRTADGIRVLKVGDALVVRSGDVAYGWATVEDRWPATATTRAELILTAVTNGLVKVQLEWFDAAGGFVSATNCWSEIGKAARFDEPVSRFRPAGDKAQAFRVKLWIEGKNASATLSRLRVTTPE